MTSIESLAKRCPILTSYSTNQEGYCKRFVHCLLQGRANKLECQDVRIMEVEQNDE